jgi:hypothetical protein
MSDERSIVRVTADDRIAAMQILACIARLHRTASAGELMQQWFWARKRYRREGLPDELAIPIPDKDRINAKLPALAKDISAGLQAGRWFKRKWMAESDGALVRAAGASFRQQAAEHWNSAHRGSIKRETEAAVTSREDATAAAKQRIWTKRRPVAHRALAVSNHVRAISTERSLELEQLVFDPAWVGEALERAEDYAAVAIELKILASGEPWRFIR